MKKLFQIMLCIILLLNNIMLLSSCSTNKGVSASQLQNDIKNSEFIQNCFTSEFVYDSQYEYITHDVTKRQTNIENKEDLIYCNILARNKYFEVNFDVALEYNYYDDGGWILEKSNIENSIAKAILAPEKTLVEEFLHEKRTLQKDGTDIYVGCWYNNEYAEIRKGEYQIQDISFDENSQTSRLNMLVSSPVLSVSGYYLLQCEEDSGWNLVKYEHFSKSKVFMCIASCEFDYSKAIGTFGGGYVTIESVDIENSQITYRINNESSIIEDFDLLSSGFGFPAGLWGRTTLYYNPYQDYWYYTQGSDTIYKRK